MFKEFREFISRGNVIDLAVAVVIGAAFTKLVNSVVEGLITPVVGMVAARDFHEMTFTIRDSTFSYGTVIDAAIEFLIVAAVVFFLVVKPMNMLQARKLAGQAEEKELSDEAVLLSEIRDLLRNPV